MTKIENHQAFIDQMNEFESKDLQDVFIQGRLTCSNVARSRPRKPDAAERMTACQYFVLVPGGDELEVCCTVDGG